MDRATTHACLGIDGGLSDGCQRMSVLLLRGGAEWPTSWRSLTVVGGHRGSQQRGLEATSGRFEKLNYLN